jgi:hypothetical protein
MSYQSIQLTIDADTERAIHSIGSTIAKAIENNQPIDPNGKQAWIRNASLQVIVAHTSNPNSTLLTLGTTDRIVDAAVGVAAKLWEKTRNVG